MPGGGGSGGCGCGRSDGANIGLTPPGGGGCGRSDGGCRFDDTGLVFANKVLLLREFCLLAFTGE